MGRVVIDVSRDDELVAVFQHPAKAGAFGADVGPVILRRILKTLDKRCDWKTRDSGTDGRSRNAYLGDPFVPATHVKGLIGRVERQASKREREIVAVYGIRWQTECTEVFEMARLNERPGCRIGALRFSSVEHSG